MRAGENRSASPPLANCFETLVTLDTRKGRYMTSPERERIKAALEGAAKPLPPRSVAEAVHSPPDATRKLLWKMAQKGEVISVQGKYALPGYDAEPSQK